MTEAAELSFTTLTTVNVEKDHTVSFVELGTGRAIYNEDRLLSQASVLDKLHGATSLAEAYRILEPTAQVPAAVVAADARLTLVRSRASQAAAAPRVESATTEAPRLYTAGEVSWFEGTFCVDNGISSVASCGSGTNALSTPTITGGHFKSQEMEGSEGTANASIAVYHMQSGSWVRIFSSTVQPGHFLTQEESGTFQQGDWDQYVVHINFAGTNTTVAIATEECGEPNEHSCSPPGNTNCGVGCDPQTTDLCDSNRSSTGTCLHI